MAIESRADYHRVEVDAMGQHGEGAVRGRKGITYRMPLGKHKGAAIGDLDGRYIRRLLDFSADPSSDFKLTPKLQFLLESELSARRQAQSAKRPRRELHGETAAQAKAAGFDTAAPSPARPAPPKPQPPKPAPVSPYANDPELAEIEALLMS